LNGQTETRARWRILEELRAIGGTRTYRKAGTPEEVITRLRSLVAEECVALVREDGELLTVRLIPTESGGGL
jgi:hypothetical protein